MKIAGILNSDNYMEFSLRVQKTMSTLVSLLKDVLSGVQDIDTVVASFKKGYLDDVGLKRRTNEIDGEYWRGSERLFKSSAVVGRSETQQRHVLLSWK